MLEKTNVFFCRKKHFAPFSVATEGKSVLFFGKNVDFRPKQVGEKSQFSLISKAFSGKGGISLSKDCRLPFLLWAGGFIFFFLPYIRARSVPKLKFCRIFFAKGRKTLTFRAFSTFGKIFLFFLNENQKETSVSKRRMFRKNGEKTEGERQICF